MRPNTFNVGLRVSRTNLSPGRLNVQRFSLPASSMAQLPFLSCSNEHTSDLAI